MLDAVVQICKSTREHDNMSIGITTDMDFLKSFNPFSKVITDAFGEIDQGRHLSLYRNVCESFRKYKIITTDISDNKKNIEVCGVLERQSHLSTEEVDLLTGEEQPKNVTGQVLSIEDLEEMGLVHTTTEQNRQGTTTGQTTSLLRLRP